MGANDFKLMSEEEMNTFWDDLNDDSIETKETLDSSEEEPKDIENNDINETTEEPDAEHLFDEYNEKSDGTPESVGSEDSKDKGKSSSKQESNSPNSNLYSSIAKAFAEDGVFPDLNSDDYADVDNAEKFRDLVNKQIQSGLNEVQKRIYDAMKVGLEPTEIQKHEGALNYLNSISSQQIEAEGDEGDRLRKNLIFQDFINRGYSKERAAREVDKSFNAGTDLEDAKEALLSNREYFQERYNGIIESARRQQQAEEADIKKRAEELKNSILTDKELFGDISIDKATRQKVYDNIVKPIFKDPESGEYYTAIQKYELENREDFLKKVGLIFTLTDGFKNLDKIVASKVQKEKNKAISALERTLNTSSRNADGSINFHSKNDENSFFRGYKLDV